MKKLGISLMGFGFLITSSTILAANISEDQITNFTKKLDTNKTQLLDNLEASKKKLESVAKENTAITDTTLFKAASCLGAISEEDKNLDFNKLVSELQEAILNEYIKLDGDIKRLSFGLTTEDPIVFEGTLDTFYNQNAQKITDLESTYYTKATAAKNNFLAYVDNNTELLNDLAVKLDAFNMIENAANEVTAALEDFSGAINAKSTLLADLEKARTESENAFEAQLDKIIAESIEKFQPNGDIQAQYYINKDNFIKKYKTEIKKSEYYLFSALFSYETYESLLDKKANVDKQFLNSDGAVDCSLLLTTSFNISNYAKDTDATSASLVKGLNLLTDAIKDGKINMSILEAPTVTWFQKDSETLTRKLLRNFRTMLESITPEQEAESETGAVEGESQEAPVVNVVFTQAFTKNKYYEQVKTLQTVLKNRGYYDGEITGIYSPATIEAVYHFQLKEGIITGNEKDKSAYGRFGTATRNRMNALLQQ